LRRDLGIGRIANIQGGPHQLSAVGELPQAAWGTMRDQFGDDVERRVHPEGPIREEMGKELVMGGTYGAGL